MANSENLKPNSERTPSERRANAKKAGIKSGEKRRERKKFKELLEIALLLPDEESGKQNDFAIVAAIIKKAANGDTKAFELIRDTVGEKPIDKQLTVEGTKADLEEIVIDKEGIQKEIEKTRMLADE